MSPQSRWPSLRDAPAPTSAVHIGSHRVSAATLEVRAGRPVVTAHVSEPLPGGALVPSLTGQNARDRAAVVTALTRVLDGVGRPRRVGLIIPDPVAKVSLVRLAQVPARANDLDQVLRWQVRKTAPFPVEDAQVTHTAGSRTPEGQEFVVALAKRDVIAEYEGLCASAGAHAGLVDLHTLNVVNAVLAGPSAPAGDWLLVTVAPDYASIVIVRESHLILFRSRGADAEGTLTDLVHQTAMYYEDRLEGSGFSRVMLSGGTDASGHADVTLLRRSVEERLNLPVEGVDVSAAAALADRITPGATLVDTLAPLVGLLRRDHPAARA